MPDIPNSDFLNSKAAELKVGSSNIGENIYNINKILCKNSFDDIAVRNKFLRLSIVRNEHYGERHKFSHFVSPFVILIHQKHIYKTGVLYHRVFNLSIIWRAFSAHGEVG